MVFTFGPLQISVYGILIALGALVAYGATIALLWLKKESERTGSGTNSRVREIEPDPSAKLSQTTIAPDHNHIDSVLLWALIPAVVFARLMFVLYHLDYFGANPQEIIAVWHGGWVWHGALLGGLLGIYSYCKKANVSPLLLLDALAPGVALGQAIGRWGNFFNQEAYGLPTNIPWGIGITPDKRLPGYETFTTFHPTFFYESALDATLFIFLGWLLLKRDDHVGKSSVSYEARTEGVIFFLYLLLYSLGRFFIEFLRIDTVPVILGLRAPQWISLALMIVGALGLAWVLRKQKKMV